MMRYTIVFKAFFSLRAALQVLFLALSGGARCIRCGAPCGAQQLCKRCLSSFYAYEPLFSPGARCTSCGKRLISEHEVCMECRKQPVLLHTDGVFPLHAYRFWNKTLLHEWKTGVARSLSPVFAKAVYQALEALYQKVGATIPVVPVPPRPGKVWQTGWDQIAELTFLLRITYGVPVCPLLRRTSVLQQKKLGRKERLSALHSAYVCKSAYKDRKKPLPQAVVLLDDVLTTGATIESCARSLKACGVQTVYAITLFVVD